jgi:hypothetical protein
MALGWPSFVDYSAPIVVVVARAGSVSAGAPQRTALLHCTTRTMAFSGCPRLGRAGEFECLRRRRSDSIGAYSVDSAKIDVGEAFRLC